MKIYLIIKNGTAMIIGADTSARMKKIMLFPDWISLRVVVEGKGFS